MVFKNIICNEFGIFRKIFREEKIYIILKLIERLLVLSVVFKVLSGFLVWVFFYMFIVFWG